MFTLTAWKLVSLGTGNCSRITLIQVARFEEPASFRVQVFGIGRIP